MQLLQVPTLHYVNDESGVVSTSDALPSGLHYEYSQKQDFIAICIVRDETSEVLGEYQGWESFSELLSVLGWE